jgi:hypothetical protein
VNLAKTLQKLESIREGPDRVIFGYKFCGKTVADYVSLTNLRMEIVQVNQGQIMHTLAAPVLEVRHGKSYIDWHDSDLVMPTTGPRANIILRSRYLKKDEQASPASNCRAVMVTEDSDERLLNRVIALCSKPAYPGIDMREPSFFRCTKNPERMRLNYVPELLAALGLESGVSADVLKEAFMAAINTVTIPTEGGYVVPFEWVYAGGMVVTPALDLGKLFPKTLYVRTPQFFQSYVAAKQWGLQCI